MAGILFFGTIGLVLGFAFGATFWIVGGGIVSMILVPVLALIGAVLGFVIYLCS